MKKLLICMVLILICSGCADTVTFDQAKSINPVGFLHGLWHGFTFVFSWVGSIINDDIALYAIYNNGGGYDFGYFLGVAVFGVGGSRSSND